ncbi:MAG TPA: TIGR00159 family protein, partial [Candidatus Gallibacteroides avistercoris]|nr:TIGR00159 family protein [Candidatus Gallibacteroides avistercoris]
MQDFGIKDAIDIFLVALLLYNMFKLMKESGNINIFTGILSFIGVWIVVTQILDMKL